MAVLLSAKVIRAINAICRRTVDNTATGGGGGC